MLPNYRIIDVCSFFILFHLSKYESCGFFEKLKYANEKSGNEK